MTGWSRPHSRMTCARSSALARSASVNRLSMILPGARWTAMNVRVTALHTTTTACTTRAKRNRPIDKSRARRSRSLPARTFVWLLWRAPSLLCERFSALGTLDVERIEFSSTADGASGWEDAKFSFLGVCRASQDVFQLNFAGSGVC